MSNDKAAREKMALELALKQEVSVERTEMLHVRRRAKTAEDQAADLTARLSKVRVELGEAEETVLRKTLQSEHAAEVAKAEIAHLKDNVAAECKKFQKVETELHLHQSQLAATAAKEATSREHAKERAEHVDQLQKQLRSAGEELSNLRETMTSLK